MKAIHIATGLLLASAICMAHGQTGIPFYTSTEAVGINLVDPATGVSSWSAMNHTTEGVPVVNFGASKNSEIDAEFHEFIPASASGMSAYLGGVRVTPDLSALFSKSNLPADSFTAFFQGGFGESLVNGGPNRFTGMVGGGFGYRATTAVGFNVIDGYCMFVGNGHCNPTLSSGIVVYLNQAASKAMMVKKRIARAALINQLTR